MSPSRTVHQVPAACGKCGFVFPSGFALVEGAHNIRFEGNVSQCPRCGSDAPVLDGIYDAVEGALRVVLTSERSESDLRSLLDALKRAREGNASPEDIREVIKTHAPELQNVTDALPQTRNELYAFITALCTMIAMVIAGYALFEKKGPTEDELKAMVAKAVADTMSQKQTMPKDGPPKQIMLNRPARPNRHQRRAQVKAKHK